MSETTHREIILDNKVYGTDGGSGSGGGASKIAEREISPTENPHAKDDYIYYNDTIYKVTTNIAAGTSLVVGTNITTDLGLEAGTQVLTPEDSEALSAGDISYGEGTVEDALDDVKEDITELNSNSVPKNGKYVGIIGWTGGQVLDAIFLFPVHVLDNYNVACTWVGPIGTESATPSSYGRWNKNTVWVESTNISSSDAGKFVEGEFTFTRNS